MTTYNITITHPNNGTVSARVSPDITADKFANIPNGAIMTGEIARDEVDQVWARIIDYPKGLVFDGYYVALKYGKDTFATWSPVGETPNPTRRFAFVQHGFQSKYMGYKNYMDWRGFRGAGDPSCYSWIATSTTKPIHLNQWMQELIHGFNITSSQGTMSEAALRSDWANLTAWNKAFTNKGNNRDDKDKSYADWILGRNTEKRYNGIRALNVLPTGATIELVGEKYKRFGTWCQDFKIADMLDANTFKMTWKTHWQYVVAATNSVRASYNAQGKLVPDDKGKKEIIDPFPKMQNDRTTFWLLMGLGTSIGTTYADGLMYLDYEPTRPLYPYYPFRNRGIGDYENEFWDTRMVLNEA